MRNHPIILILMCFLPLVPALADGRWELDLSGPEWQMEGIRPGQGVRENFHLHTGEVGGSTFNWNAATIPGDVYTDLWRAGEIDDPHYGRNGIRAKWAMEREWWYRRAFSVPDSQKGRNIHLAFDGVDYACEVWFNGTHLGRHEGMFSRFDFDVTKLVRFGSGRKSNGLVIRLDPPPRLYRNVAGRKFGWHGDYWRTITPMGIWKPVRVLATGPIRFSDIHPTSVIHEDGSASVTINVELKGSAPIPDGGLTMKAVIRGANCETGTHHAELILTEKSGSVSIRIPDAKLWWPWDLGKPNLHLLETRLIDSKGIPWDHLTTRFAIREIRMERNPGYTEDEVMHPWTPVINGKPIFLRSANWGGPPDIFYGRNTPEHYRHLIKLAREANLNNLRIFGWHPTEIDLFYDLCDENGITVWQDLLPIASVSLPEDKAFREATYAEAVSVIKQLRNHPCLILLEGGEESFYGTQGLENNASFLLELEDAIRPHTTLPYIPTSPLDWPRELHALGLGKPKDSGHTHKMFYSIGAVLMEDEVKHWDFAAIPEFGVSSAPCADSIRKFIPADELWPPGPSWGYHWADLDILRSLNFQVLGDERTGSLGEFADATQIAQGTIFQFGIESFRRRKPKSSAISICHFITFSPDMKWGIVDYYGKTKLSYDFVRRAYQPVLASMEFDQRRWLEGESFQARLWVVNDRHQTYENCRLITRISSGEDGEMIEQVDEVGDLAPNGSEPVSSVEWKVVDPSKNGFRVDLQLETGDGKIISSNHYVLLHGDQEQARKDCAELARKFKDLRGDLPAANYHRYFPGLDGSKAKDPIIPSDKGE